MFLESSLELVVVIEIAVLAFALSIHESVGMWASIGVAISAVLVIAVIAHTLGIVLLVFVGALNNFHGLALEASLGALYFGIFPLLVESFRITNWF
jgi:hypothetical protein